MPLDMYQHDSAAMFQFVLRGELIGDGVQDLEHAWKTASSILAGKELVVDVSGILKADPPGLDLLSRMRESGARLTMALPPDSMEFARSMGISVAALGRCRSTRATRLLCCFQALRSLILSGCMRKQSAHAGEANVSRKVEEKIPAYLIGG